jgi:hypothetical protein
VIVVSAGVMTRLLTVSACSDAVPVTPAADAVTVCWPDAATVQVGPEHEPSGWIVNVALGVTSPVELP